MSKHDENTHRDKMSKLVQRWHGCQVEWSQYTASHCRLTIRVFAEDRTNQLRIVCAPCSRISGPVYWQDNRLHFRFFEAGNADENCIVWDETSGFVAVCGALSVNEA